MNIENIKYINKKVYQNTFPFPYITVDNILNFKFASEIQTEILELSDELWDRYDNPFEKKYTLRNKNKLPKNTQLLFDILTSDDFKEKTFRNSR